MRIRRLEIENFRGIKSLEWDLPSDQRLIALVGPGDSGKSTILEAVHYLLGNQWLIPFSDTDFYKMDVSQPVSIKAVIGDVPRPLLKESAFGLWLSGMDADGLLHQDPEDLWTPVLITRLTVDESLEAQWSVERVDGQSQMLTAGQRQHFSTFKVDDRNDAQLRWTRTSALGRMSRQDGGERQALAEASRAAQQALAQNQSDSLNILASKIQTQVNAIGGGNFRDMKPGLDTSRSSMGAGLALYENVVPLANFGLGSRRLASLAIQQLAAGDRSVAVVDEIENGLEPHRSVRLMEYLTDADEYSQVFVTTHSPVIVEQAQIENLAVVQNHSGVVTVASLRGASKRMQQVRRSRPSSLLGRRIVVVEGKTEQGLLSAWIEHWDKERSAVGLSTSAGEGVAVQDGQGGSEVALRCEALNHLGYQVIGLMDNDDDTVDKAVDKARSFGIEFVRWDKGNSLEDQLCSNLKSGVLTEILKLATELRAGPDTVMNDLMAVDPASPITSLDVNSWIADGMPIEEARARVAKASLDKEWFKDVARGRQLGEWVLEHRKQEALQIIVERLDSLRDFIYSSDSPRTGAEPGQEVVDG